MVAHPVLVHVGGIVGPVQIQQHMLGRPAPPPLAQVEADQGAGQPLDGPPIDGVLQPREGGLAGQIRPTLGQAAAGQLQQRV